MKSKIWAVASSTFAMVSLVGCAQVEGQKPTAMPTGEPERCRQVGKYCYEPQISTVVPMAAATAGTATVVQTQTRRTGRLQDANY